MIIYFYAAGAALIIERPKGFDKDGGAINKLFAEMKETIKSGLFCRGVYASDKIELLEKLSGAKISIFTLLSGLPFPAEQLDEMFIKAQNEIKNIEDKKTKQKKIDYNMDQLISYIEESTKEAKPQNDLDFRIFKDEFSDDWMRIFEGKN